MADHKRNRRPSLTVGERMMFFAGILFCLVLISTAMMGGLFARYITSDTGQDNARVARFGDLTLTETGDFVEKEGVRTGIIIPGVNLKKKVTLTFEPSEVATYVFVQVTATDWTMTADRNFMKGTQLSWIIADGWTYLPGSEYVYYQVLPPNTTFDNVDIIDRGVVYVGTDIKESNIQTLANLNLSFRAGVIQTDGSLTPQEAWDKLN